MINYYRCNPEDIEVYIWPSIRRCHFEVDRDVKELCEDIFGFTGRTNDFIEKGLIKYAGNNNKHSRKCSCFFKNM